MLAGRAIEAWTGRRDKAIVKGEVYPVRLRPSVVSALRKALTGKTFLSGV